MSSQTVPSDAPSGYTVTYSPDLGQARVYGVGGVGVLLIVTAFFQGSPLLFVAGAGALLVGAYYLPLIETGRARIGATQYGVFVEGLGLIGWREITDIKHVSIAVRTMTTHELQLKLGKPIPGALLADWRKLPWYRLAMHLPWRMSDDNVIRIPLDTMARKPDEIERRFKRMWTHFRQSGGAKRVTHPGGVPVVEAGAQPTRAPELPDH